jgi:hypothetical protein
MHARVAALLVVILAVAARGADAPPAAASGTVVDPFGKPVEGAEVIVATPGLAAWPNHARNKQDEWRRGAGTTTTDKQGRFTIKLPKDAGLISINHPKLGYAEAKPADEPLKVKLEPWCRVEGVLKIGVTPAPKGTKVSLFAFAWTAEAARVHYAYDTTTDEKRHYVLDRVPAGLVKIITKVSKTGAPLEQYTSASPDKPTHFDLGGKGRPVIWKLSLPESVDLKRLNKWPGVDSISYLRRDVPWPTDPYTEGIFDQQREDELREWRRTPEAINLYFNEYRCDIDPQPDGTFRLDDVPPGRYILSFSFHSMVEGQPSQEVAAKKIDLVVPDSPACPTDEPLDLGEIELGKEGL